MRSFGIGAALGLGLGLVLTGVVWFSGRSALSTARADLQAVTTAMEEVQELNDECVSRDRLYEAQDHLGAVAVELRSENFGRAREHLASAKSLLDELRGKPPLGADDAKITAAHEKVASLELKSSGDLDAQTSHVMDASHTLLDAVEKPGSE